MARRTAGTPDQDDPGDSPVLLPRVAPVDHRDGAGVVPDGLQDLHRSHAGNRLVCACRGTDGLRPGRKGRRAGLAIVRPAAPGVLSRPRSSLELHRGGLYALGALRVDLGRVASAPATIAGSGRASFDPFVVR